LCPTFLNPNDFYGTKSNVTTTVNFGTGSGSIKFKATTLLEKLEVIKQKGDPLFVLRVEYGTTNVAGTWEAGGDLISLNTRASVLLEAIKSGANLIEKK